MKPFPLAVVIFLALAVACTGAGEEAGDVGEATLGCAGCAETAVTRIIDGDTLDTARSGSMRPWAPDTCHMPFRMRQTSRSGFSWNLEDGGR